MSMSSYPETCIFLSTKGKGKGGRKRGGEKGREGSGWKEEMGYSAKVLFK